MKKKAIKLLTAERARLNKDIQILVGRFYGIAGLGITLLSGLAYLGVVEGFNPAFGLIPVASFWVVAYYAIQARHTALKGAYVRRIEIALNDDANFKGLVWETEIYPRLVSGNITNILSFILLIALYLSFVIYSFIRLWDLIERWQFWTVLSVLSVIAIVLLVTIILNDSTVRRKADAMFDEIWDQEIQEQKR